MIENYVHYIRHDDDNFSHISPYIKLWYNNIAAKV